MNQGRIVPGLVVAIVVVVVAVFVVRRINDSPEDVAIVGDSITVMSNDAIEKTLGKSHVDIRAQLGQRIDDMLPQLRDALAEKPDAVVLNLGTNDVLQGTTHPDWQPGFLQMVQAVADENCVVLVTINDTVRSATVRPEFAGAINQAIAQATDSHDNFHVIDWNAMVHAPGGDELLLDDGIHPSVEGAQRLAREIRHTLDDDC